MYFSLPPWYAFTGTFPNSLCWMMLSIYLAIAIIYILEKMQVAHLLNCAASTSPTNIRWFNILANANGTMQEVVDHTSTPACLMSVSNAGKCNVGYRLLAEGEIITSGR